MPSGEYQAAEEDVENAPKSVREFLTRRLKEFSDDSRFVDSLQGHIEAIQPRSGRAEKPLALMRELAAF